MSIIIMKVDDFMNKCIDLHIHSNISDGTLSPKEIIDEAHKNNISVISITDHDTIGAYNNGLFEYAKEKNIEIIPGVEVSTKTEKAGIHVLGYNINLNNKELKDTLYNLRNARHIYLHDVSEKLRFLGYKVNENKLDKIDAVTKAHIAYDIINNIENRNILLKEFNCIPPKGDFIEKIMNEGCIAYVEKISITPKDAANVIRQAGGKVVLAHPVAYGYEDGLDEQDILDIIMEMKADGIESNYIYIDQNNKKVNDSKRWNEFAEKYNLFTTIGSDFHKKDDIHAKMGLINDLLLEENEINTILNNLK